ncbi:MAG: HAMP domain-containing histidine kinase, partial [Deltaproteobacteria bacterium]|nr:HAMP domain-containing histidine kinase [Deltaproteobacteria bacterium]
EYVLNQASEDIDRLTRLINDLLDLSRLQSGKIKVTRSPLKARPLLEAILGKFQVIAEQKNAFLKLEADENLPEIYAEEDKIYQVVNNLLNNAFRYSQKGVIVRAEILNELSFQTLKVSVIDDGKGIAPEQAAKLFNKFIQLDRTVGGSGYKGTGLGLAICKEIIEQHDGKIWVESELGQGARFQFTIPCYQLDLEFWLPLERKIAEATQFKTPLSFLLLSAPPHTIEAEQWNLLHQLMREKILRKNDELHLHPNAEHLVMLVQTDTDGMESIKKRITEILHQSHPELVSSLKLGGSQYPQDGSPASHLIRQALEKSVQMT